MANKHLYWIVPDSSLQFDSFYTQNLVLHYENTPIQIYWKFYNQTRKFSDKSSDIFHISAQNIDCGYSLEPHRRGGSNDLTIYVLAK